MQRKPIFSQQAPEDSAENLEVETPAHIAERNINTIEPGQASASMDGQIPRTTRPVRFSAERSQDGSTLVSRIKNRLPLIEYANTHLQLKQAPGNSGEFTGKCPSPDHDDSTASFYASTKTDAYYCHGCGISGNVIHLYALVNGMEYADAKMQLGRELGVFNERKSSPFEDMMLDSARKYISQLERKADALQYLTQDRKLTPESIEKWGLGFCWGREYQDWSPEHKKEALSLGLLRAASESSPEKSHMSGRITFPVRDRLGRVVGFGGRLVPSEFKSFGPKYINSPETEIFKKSEILYGAYEAAPAISKSGYAIALEGYMDVIATHQAGVENTVAVMGASANESTFETFWEMTNKVVFCLDGDAAGQTGALRSVMAAAATMPDGCEIGIARLPSGMDPDEFVIKHGADAFRSLCESATPMSRFLMENLANDFDLSYPEGRTGFITAAKDKSDLFVIAPKLRAEIVAEAGAINAAGLARYALSANHVGDNVDNALLERAIALLQSTLQSRKNSHQVNFEQPSTKSMDNIAAITKTESSIHAPHGTHLEEAAPSPNQISSNLQAGDESLPLRRPMFRR